jgi:hypothetical protein
MISIHPWSTVFNRLWHGCTSRITSFDEIGVINHIVELASCVVVMLMRVP